MQKSVYHKIKLQVTPNTKKNSSRSKGGHDFLPTPPFSVLCSRSRTMRGRPVCTGRFGNCCAGPQAALLANSEPPRHRRGSCGACWWGQEIWTAQLQSQPVSTPSGLRGASCQVPFQEWCHFHRGLTVAPWQCLGTQRADQRTWPEWNPQHAGPVRDQAFLAFSRRRGSTTTGQADTAQERIQNNPSRSCVSPRGTRKLQFPYMSISQIEVVLLQTKAASFPPPRPNWPIASKCLPVLRKYAIEQEMKKYPFLPKGRGRNHIPIQTGNQLIRIPAMSGKWLSPSSTQGVMKAEFLSGFCPYWGKSFQARTICL